MAHIFITRAIPSEGVATLQAAGHEVVVSEKQGVLTKEELIAALQARPYEAVLCLLTDHIDADVLKAAGAQCKIFANYAVGFDNIDVGAAHAQGVMVTNTPGVLTDTVAEHTFALMLAIAHRIAEADRFARAGNYHGWEPMMLLGTDVAGSTLGVVGLGRIGARVAHHAAKGFGARVLYYDVKRNENFERESGAVFCPDIKILLPQADFVSIHVPLSENTHHLINKETLALMKPTAYLINTSRGPVVDEAALAEALTRKTIRGAALDVFEEEPKIHPQLLHLENIILTPHIASATEQTRGAMARLAAENIIAVLSGAPPPNAVT